MCVSVVDMFFFFFKQKTAYEMRISDWSSDACSSDLKSERRDVDIDAFFTDAAGVPGPVNELAIAICRDDDRATPRHERAAQVMQGSLSRSHLGIKSRPPYGSTAFFPAGF